VLNIEGAKVSQLDATDLTLVRDLLQLVNETTYAVNTLELLPCLVIRLWNKLSWL
jgi:hypothetical protein